MRVALRRLRSGSFRAGFSLLELLLVVAILVVVLTLYWGPSSGSREAALHSACQRNLQKLHIAFTLYANDSLGKFPAAAPTATSAEALDPLVPRYNSDTSLFICPAAGDLAKAAGKPLRSLRISYAYYAGRSLSNSVDALLTDRQVNAHAKSRGQPLFSATGKGPGSNHRKSGGNILFCDGHLELSPPAASMDLPIRPGETLLNP